jgi:hypothetical protein
MRHFGQTIGVAALVTSGIVGACSSYNEDPQAPQTGDASAPDGGADAIVIEPPSDVFYVSPNGSDTADGRAPSTAFLTVRQSLLVAQGLKNPEVRVCKGVYAENDLSLGAKITLQGGYACDTWTRAASFGAVGGFEDDANDTVLAAGPNQTNLAALTVGAGAVARIIGFRINGVGGGATRGAGILVSDGTLGITECDVRGNTAPQNAETGTAGIVTIKGNLTVSNSRVTGGSGRGDGSIGIRSQQANTNVSSSEIMGGTGTGQSGVWGIVILGGIARVNAVHVRGSVFPAGNADRIGGIWSRGADIEVSDSVLEGATATTTSVAAYTESLELFSEGDVRLRARRNWITAGTLLSATKPSVAYGILVSVAADGVIENNVVHADSRSATVYARGLITGGGSLLVAHNTVLTRGSASSYGLEIAHPLASTRVENNLSLGSEATVSLLLYWCTDAGYAMAQELLSLRNNAIAGASRFAGYRGALPNACPATNLPSVMTAAFTTAAGPNAQSNVDVELHTVRPVDPSEWRRAVIEKRIEVAPDAQCGVARKGKPGTGITSDIFGKGRSTTTPTIGAIESGAVCP